MRWGGRYRDDFTVNVNWEGCWQSKNPAKEGEDELVLSGSGNKAEEGSHNPHMRFINALAVDLVAPLKYFGLSPSVGSAVPPPPVIRAAPQVTPSSESSLGLFLLLRKIS